MAVQIEGYPVSWNIEGSNIPTQAEVIGRGLARSLDNVERWIDVLKELGEVEILNEYEVACAALFAECSVVTVEKE